MKTKIAYGVTVCAVVVLLTICGCKDATRTTENQELTRQRQAKIQERKSRDEAPDLG